MIRSTLVFCLLAVMAGPALAAHGGKALLIGVEGYEKVPALKYVGNDVRRLAESLSDRCGFEVKHVIDTAVNDTIEKIGPTTHRDALMKTIEEWVDGMQETDTAILYFSGHGFVDDEGKLYLASLNCDSRDPVPGGVPVEWLREQLSRCPARCKVLLLDACHAGTGKSLEGGGTAAKAIEVEMRKLANVATLASCEGWQQSYLWDGKRHSLFTYWLAEAAKGHAESDGDGRVSMDELTNYVTGNVSKTAKSLSYEQTPILLGGSEAGKPLALAPKAISLVRLIKDLAEKIDTQMRQKKYSSVGIPEFSSDERGATLAITYGTLPAYIANKLTDELAQLADGDYEVMSGPALHQELTRRRVDATNIETAEISDLSVGGVDIAILAIGRISSRSGATFTLGCKLKKPGSPSQLGSANGVCFLNESEWAMLGRSVRMKPEVPSTASGTSLDAAMAQRIAALDEGAARPHPQIDPGFPFRIEIWVKDTDGEFQRREGMVRGNDYFVPMKQGEVYRILVHNRFPAQDGAFLRLLVDGLNTLPELRTASQKGVTVELRDGAGELTVAPRTNLAEARPWYLDPPKVDGGGNVTPATYCIRGFYQEVGEDGKFNEFVVTDAPESAAARKGYTDQIGLITAALYRPTKPRALGTKLGNEYRQQVNKYGGGLVPGELIGVINVRYDEP